jgi:hypothetical protein
MADRMPAKLTIGGPIPRSLVKDLCEKIRGESVSLDWDEELFEPASEADLQEALEDGRLVLCDSEAIWGRFNDLERFLDRSHIAYDRHNSAKYDNEAELIRHRPGLGIFVDQSNDSEDILHSDKDVQQVRALLKDGNLAKAMAKLDAMCPDVPELPPFTVV